MTDASGSSAADSGARAVADRMAEAARAWLRELDDEQRAAAVGVVPATDAADTERRRWFYTPTDHGGLPLAAQRPSQQWAAMRLLASGLSTAGYVTVATTMGLEHILDRSEGFVARFDRERGRDPGYYYLRVFGEPGPFAPWGWRFGGHHVSINNLVVGGVVVATTPCFMGADPACSPLLGGAVSRPLGVVEDLGREIARSLRGAHLARALLLDRAPNDVVTGNRSRVMAGDRAIPLTGIWRTARLADESEQARLQAASDAQEAIAGFSDTDHRAVEYTDDPKGVPGHELDGAQRELMLRLLSTYFDRVPSALSPMASYDEDALDALHFAWAGPTEPGQAHYYRVQGPGLLLEWDNAQRAGNHAHSVWRNPAADFGIDVLARHYATTDHTRH
jgi:hypothetical protein